MSFFFLQFNLEKYECIFPNLVFQLENLSYLKSYQNMLTFSNLILYVISYKYSFSNIYIAWHLHVKKN